jgi:multidrug resistance efflux pump
VVVLQLEAEEEALKAQLATVEMQRNELDEQIAKEVEKAKKLDEEADRSVAFKQLSCYILCAVIFFFFNWMEYE